MCPADSSLALELKEHTQEGQRSDSHEDLIDERLEEAAGKSQCHLEGEDFLSKAMRSGLSVEVDDAAPALQGAELVSWRAQV